MSRLTWSQPALFDAQRLYRFLATKNLDAAKRVLKAIRQAGAEGHPPRRAGASGPASVPLSQTCRSSSEWIIDFGDSGNVAR